jgi:hypothetical protein
MAKSRFLSHLVAAAIAVLTMLIGAAGISQYGSWIRWNQLQVDLASLCDSTFVSTEGDRIITLNDDKEQSIAILKLASQMHRPTCVTSGRIELRNLDVELLDDELSIENVFSVSVTDDQPVGFSEAKKLRHAFPNCSLWTFPKITWEDAVRSELSKFPNGSSIQCYQKPPSGVHHSGFLDLGQAGVTWSGK